MKSYEIRLREIQTHNTRSQLGRMDSSGISQGSQSRENGTSVRSCSRERAVEGGRMGPPSLLRDSMRGSHDFMRMPTEREKAAKTYY